MMSIVEVRYRQFSYLASKLKKTPNKQNHKQHQQKQRNQNKHDRGWKG